ncbi:MAG: molybdenum cofactor guanylyltransferase [Acidimicrobiia bacterium]
MIPLYILAGGASSRFGSDKARAELAGVPLIVRVVSGLSAVVGPATVVAAVPNAYDDLGLSTIGDLVPGQGPLGGLVTALGDAGGPVFLAACDLREPRADWAEAIVAAEETAAFRTHHTWEPLFARYELSAVPVAQGLLDRGERSMQKLLDELGTAVPVPADWPTEPSFNRPEDLG